MPKCAGTIERRDAGWLGTLTTVQFDGEGTKDEAETPSLVTMVREIGLKLVI